MLTQCIRWSVIVLACTALACSLETRGVGPAGAPFEADAGASAPLDATTTSDATTPDAAGAQLEATTPEAAADAPELCDQDSDGHRATGHCGGDDCCDTDARAHPGQKSYFDSPDACGSFDYDCNGTVSAEFGVANCQLGFFSCSGDGFETSTACGGSSPFASCSWAGVSCNRSDAPKTQRCN